MANKKLTKVGVDLDGVVAKHSMGGFWVYLRKVKESFLKKTHSSNYYYPSTAIERSAWKIINGRRKPFNGVGKHLDRLLKKNNIELFLITSRFKFLEKLTYQWLKKYNLDYLFVKVFINSKNQDPLTFKLNAVKKLNLDCLIDDDLEVVEYLKGRTDKKLFWVNIHKVICDRKDLKSIIVCKDFIQALDKIKKMCIRKTT